MAVAAAQSTVPFLGLHYFDEGDESIFFGRDEQLRDLLTKLRGTRFVTIIGSSGSGKSSLARAALIPALRDGFLTDAGNKWHILKTHPGSSPTLNFAEKLEAVFCTTGLETTLRRGPLGLIEAVRQAGMRKDANLLVMVDQFEEIFRYQRESQNKEAAVEESAAFVKLLLAATASLQPSIFVLLTMRSDYLGACAQFRDLPERINTGLYLIPRMRRDQLEEAITGPAAVMGAQFTAPLVQRLLNDAGDDPDQLPVLQHALLRTWIRWREENTSKEIDFRHYESTGGVQDGLNKHAEEIFGQLSIANQDVAEVLFRSLTERDPSNHDIRRPTKLAQVAAIARVAPDDVGRVIEQFRAEHVAFLNPAPPTRLDKQTDLDITHEALIRKWYRLGGGNGFRGWVQEEAELRDQYKELVVRARRARHSRSVLRGADLDTALAWRGRRLPEVWATRYEADPQAFGLVQEFIDRSVNARRLTRIGLGMMVLAALAAIVWVRWDQQRKAYAAQVARNQAAVQAATDQANREQEALREADRTKALNTLKALAADRERLADKATHEAQLAEKYRRIATARQLASQSEGLKERDSRIELSALLAAESLHRDPLAEGMAAVDEKLPLLRKPLWSTGHQEGKGQNSPTEGSFSLLFSKDGRYLARCASGDLHVYETLGGAEVSLPTPLSSVISAAWPDEVLYVLIHDRKPHDSIVSPTFPAHVVSLRPGAGQPEVLGHFTCRGFCMLTPEGANVLTLSESGGVALLYPVNGLGQPQEIGKLPGIRRASPLGRFVLHEAENGELILFDTKDKITESIGRNVPTELFDFQPDANLAAIYVGDHIIRLYETSPKLQRGAQLPAETDPTAMALSPDGRLLVIGDQEGGITVFDREDRSKRAMWSHPAPIIAVRFSPDGSKIASLDTKGTLRMVSLNDPLKLIVAGKSSPYKVFFDKSERNLIALSITGLRLTARVLDVSTGAEAMPQILASNFNLVTSPDKGYVGYTELDGTIAIVQLGSGTTARIKDPHGKPWSLLVSGDDKYLALRPSVTVDKNTKGGPYEFFDVSRGVFVEVPPEIADSQTLSFSADGQRVAAIVRKGNDSRVLVAFQNGSWTKMGDWELPSSPDSHSFFPEFSPDGKFLLVTDRTTPSGGNSRLHLYSVDARRELELTIPEGHSVGATQFSQDGHWLVIASGDREVYLYELPSAKFVKALTPDVSATFLVFSPSGNYLAIGAPHMAPRVYRIPNLTEVSRTGVPEKERVLAFQFVKNETELIVVSRPDASSSEHELFITLHPLQAEDLRVRACNLVSRNLTAEEWKTYLPDYQYPRSQETSTCPEFTLSPQVNR